MKKVKDPFNFVKGKIPKYYPVNNAVVFFDVVGFTKNSTNEDMKVIISRIEEFLSGLLWDNYNWHEMNKPNDLILMPTGDGYAIGFHPAKFSPKDVLSIALEIYKRIVDKGGIQIRMGIANGPNIRHLDLNDHVNLFGFGINTASRVMSLARFNQILIHEDFAKDILREQKIVELVNIGEYKIKHGHKIKVYNYFRKNDFGNPKPPDID